MSVIKESMFDAVKDDGYSNVEFDIINGKSIRKNHTLGSFEMFIIKTGEVEYTGTLSKMVEIANIRGDSIKIN